MPERAASPVPRFSARRGPWLAGASFALAVLVPLVVPASWPRWALMWLLAFAIYWACKFLTWTEADTRGVSRGRQGGYLLGWPGMNATRFFSAEYADRSHDPKKPEWLAALGTMLLGAILFWNAGHGSAATRRSCWVGPAWSARSS